MHFLDDLELSSESLVANIFESPFHAPPQSSSSGNRGTISGSQTPHSGQAAEFSSGPTPLQLPCGPLDDWGEKWGENVFW